MSSLRWAILIFGALVLVAIYLHGRYLRGRSESPGLEDEAATADRLERREPDVDASSLAGLVVDAYQDVGVPVLRDIPPYQREREDESLTPAPPERRRSQYDDAPPAPPAKDVDRVAGAPSPELSTAADESPAAEDPDNYAAAAVDERADGPSKLIMVYVIADEGGFGGEDIHRVLQREGLVLGEDGTFKRYVGLERATGAAFQVASAVEPGVFEPERLAETTTPGLVMFATLPGPKAAALVLKEIVETARSVADSLGGSILDETRQVLTDERYQALADEMAVFDAATVSDRR